jgi:hypothetical protein
MFADQNGKCAICEKHSTEFSKNLAVDHCHLTGNIRGLLCDNCNRGMGLMGDNKINLQRAVEYLHRSELAENKTNVVEIFQLKKRG